MLSVRSSSQGGTLPRRATNDVDIAIAADDALDFETTLATLGEPTRAWQSRRRAFGGVVLDDITAARVRSWHAAFGTIRKTARVHANSRLRTILNAAVDEELLADNPCHIRGAGVHRSSRPIRPATLADLETIANAMPKRYRLMVHLATSSPDDSAGSTSPTCSGSSTNPSPARSRLRGPSDSPGWQAAAAPSTVGFQTCREGGHGQSDKLAL
jgi:hypothetical protein